MKNAIIVFAIILNLTFFTNSFNLNVENLDDDEIDTTQSVTVKIDTDNLCEKLKCNIGEVCVFHDGVPTCECIEDCHDVTDERLKVCSTSNTTYESECHFHREKCWCSREDNKCTESKSIKDTIDYFGVCQSVDQCTEEQKSVFPIRMQLWLDEVLIHLSKTGSNSNDKKKFEYFDKLSKRSGKANIERHWIYGVMFEFCQLDKSHDGMLNIDEIKDLIVPIKALENCIQPFLKECDINKDSKISDLEWSKCLDLTEGELVILRESCKA